MKRSVGEMSTGLVAHVLGVARLADEFWGILHL